LPDKLRSLFLFNTERAIMLDGIQLWARLCRQPVEAIRQWRAVPVPLEYLRFAGDNDIRVSAPAAVGATIYGDYPSVRNTISLPSLKYLSGGKSLHEIQTYDMRTSENGSAFQVAGNCTYLRAGKPPVSGDLSAAPGKQFGAYRIYLALGYPQESRSDAKIVSVSPFVYTLPQLIQQGPMGLSQAVNVPKQFNAVQQLRFSLSFDKEELSRAGVYGAQFLIHGKSGESIFMPGEPLRFAEDTSNRGRCEVVVDTTPRAFSSGIDSIQLTLNSSKVPLELISGRLRVTQLQLPSFADHRLVLK
jgi:hypothetical protein